METWTHFWDMHSGGGSKEKYAHIFIEAPQAEAIRIFYARFGHNPHRVTCTCCGADYSVYEEGPEDFLSTSYAKEESSLLITADEITDFERSSPEPPKQGYVWAG